MEFIDTNYFVRFLRNDNLDQADVVDKLFIRAAELEVSLCTSVVVWFEIYWVLKSVYKHDKPSIIAGLKKILDLHFIELEGRSVCREALKLYAHENIDLEDCHHICLAKSLQCEVLASFDKKAVKAFAQF